MIFLHIFLLKKRIIFILKVYNLLIIFKFLIFLLYFIFLLIKLKKNGIVCWDINTNHSILHYNTSFGQIQSLEFINNSTQFVSSADVLRRNSTDKAIVVWDFNTVYKLQILKNS